MTAVLYAAVFFETSGDEECDPDMAMRRLEQIAYFVRQLSPTEQEEFRRHGHRLSAEHSYPSVAGQVRAAVDALSPIDLA
jgi:hypothetical protein